LPDKLKSRQILDDDLRIRVAQSDIYESILPGGSPSPPKPPSVPTLITSPGTAGRCSGLVSKPLSYDEKPFTISAKEGSVYWFVIGTHDFKRKT